MLLVARAVFRKFLQSHRSKVSPPHHRCASQKRRFEQFRLHRQVDEQNAHVSELRRPVPATPAARSTAPPRNGKRRRRLFHRLAPGYERDRPAARDAAECLIAARESPTAAIPDNATATLSTCPQSPW